MTKVATFIKSVIREQGPICVAEYFRLALTGHPESYYMRQEPFGAGGDFITAPEISQVFGECIGLWCADIWRQLGAPEEFTLVELGPGRGTLMKDMLRAGRVVTGFVEAAHVVLVEASPRLEAVQAETLGEQCARTIRWHRRFEEIKSGGCIIVVANEFFDALPIRQWVKTASGWRERVVGLDEVGRFCFGINTEIDAAALVPETLSDVPMHSIFENSVDRVDAALAIGAAIRAGSGAALVVDYGHDVPGVGDTLQGVKNHRFVDVLEEPGLADITSHVDFSVLANAFDQCGLAVPKIATQADFLLRLGAAERTHRLKRTAGAEQKAQLDSAQIRLTAPGAMGNLFKVLGAASPNGAVAAGFQA